MGGSCERKEMFKNWGCNIIRWKKGWWVLLLLGRVFRVVRVKNVNGRTRKSIIGPYYRGGHSLS